MDRATAKEIFAAQGEAARIYPAVKGFLGAAYGGAWFDSETRRLTVATTDPNLLAWIEVSGSVPVLVEYSLEELSEISKLLIELLGISRGNSGVTALRTDVQLNRIVVELRNGRQAALLMDITRDELAGLPIDWALSQDDPKFFGSLPGATEIFNEDFIVGGDRQRCSVGFGVEGGFLTAAHCGWGSQLVTNSNDEPVGVFFSSTFPPDITVIGDPGDPEISFQISAAPVLDHAFVATLDGWSTSAMVGSGVEEVSIVGSVEAPINTYVCRYGANPESPSCGKILEKNFVPVPLVRDWFTDLYPGNDPIPILIIGQMLTDICASGGDSGGGLIRLNGDQPNRGHAQGMLSGGNGAASSCSSGTRSWFSPVNPALDDLGLTLITGLIAEPYDPPPCFSVVVVERDSGDRSYSPECTLPPPLVRSFLWRWQLHPQ